MPVYEFFWYDENREHVEEHGVTLDEFEAVVCDPLRVEKKPLKRPASSIRLRRGWP